MDGYRVELHCRYQQSPFFCDVPLPRTNAGVRAVFSSDFSGLMHELYVFAGTSADDVIDALERSCPAAERYVVTEGPTIGERSLWLADAIGGTTSQKLILFSHGDTLAALSVPDGGVDAEEISRRAAERLDTLAPLASATPWPQMTCDDPVREPRGRSAELQQLLPAIDTLPAGFVRAQPPQCQFADDHDCFEPLEPRRDPRAEASSSFYAWPASSVGFTAWEFGDGDAQDVLDEWREAYDSEWVCDSNPDISHRVVEAPASPDNSFAVMTTEQRSGGGDVARYLGVIADDDVVVIVAVAYETFETRAQQRPATPDDEIVTQAIAAAKASLARMQAED